MLLEITELQAFELRENGKDRDVIVKYYFDTTPPKVKKAKRASPHGRVSKNLLVALPTKKPKTKLSSGEHRFYHGVKKILKVPMLRPALIQAVAKEEGLKASSQQPVVTALVRKGYLVTAGYVGE
jgi:hypothetical protein